jgi:hypothetical protein
MTTRVNKTPVTPNQFNSIIWALWAIFFINLGTFLLLLTDRL